MRIIFYLVLCFMVKSVMSILSILNLFKSQETSHDFYYVKPYIWLDGSLKMVFQDVDYWAKMFIVQENSYLFTLFFKLIYLDKYSAFPVVFYTGLEAISSIKRPRRSSFKFKFDYADSKPWTKVCCLPRK